MIAFDIQCANGHRFEGWFDSVQDFEDQRSRELVVCPLCGCREVERLFSPFTIKQSPSGPEKPSENEEASPERLMQAFYQHLITHYEDVGADFAKEALKIHYGVSDKKRIRGITTADEEETLKKEGVEYMKVPLPRSDA